MQLLILARFAADPIDTLVFPVISTVIAAGIITAFAISLRRLQRLWHRSRRVKDISTTAIPDISVARKYDATVERIVHLRSLVKPPITLVGAVYLDIVLYPVETKQLEHHEWTDIDPLLIGPGGAAYFVGRYLYQNFNRQSFLFSGFGSAADILSNSLCTMIADEEWVENDLDEFVGDSQSAISVHLVQRDHAQTSVFTHRGAVASLRWSQVADRVRSAVRGGGIVLISGYFKTQLQVGLRAELKQLHAQNALVIADPGSIDSSSTDRNQLSNLREELQAGLIDVHVSGYKDFLRVYGIVAGDRYPRNLEELKSRIPSVASKLAPLVFIRGTDLPDGLSVISIANGTICAAVSDASTVTHTAPISAKNGFTAALIDTLLSSAPTQSAAGSIEELATKCATLGLQGWKDACT